MSTKKPSAARSETIQDIRIDGKKIFLVLRKSTLLISEEAYLSGYYYPGKELSLRDIAHLRDLSSSSKSETYVKELLNRGRYTEKELCERLKRKYGLSYPEAEGVLAPFKESGLIDDLSYALDYLEAKIPAGYARRYLLADLRKRGVPEKILSGKEVQASFEKEKESLEDLLPILEKKEASKPVRKRKEAMYAALLRRGFSAEESQEALEHHFASRSPEERGEDERLESDSLGKEAERCYNSLRTQSLEPEKARERFFARLLRKGYSYSEVRDVLGKKGYFSK
jgi:regulatory protein